MSHLSEEQQQELRRLLRDQNVYQMAKTIPTLPPAMLEAACTQLKLQGNAFFKKKEYARAIEAYNGALIGMPDEAAIYSNRSICYMREKEYEKSLEDAEMCIKLMPEWAKGWYRYGQTLMFMERYEDSVSYFKKANELEPGNPEIRRCLREAEGLEYNQRATLANTMGQPIPKQALRRPNIAEPKFEPELLSRNLAPSDEWFADSDAARGLAIFLQNSDLIWNFPKRLVEFLDDPVLTAGWETAIEKVFTKPDWFVPPEISIEADEAAVAKDPVPTVLLFGSYLGFLLMHSLDRGIQQVQLVEPAPVYSRKVRDVLLDNYSKEKAAKLLEEVSLVIKDPLSLTVADVPDQYDVLMVGLAGNHDFFSNRVVEQIVHAKVDYLRPNHKIMPSRVQVYGRLIEWDENAASQGVDMSRVAKYRWSIVNDGFDLAGQNFHVLSDDVLVADMNLQEAGLIKPFDERVTVDVVRSGKVQGIVTWLVIEITEGVIVSNSPFIDPAESSTFRKPVFQYFDPVPVEKGGFFELTVHFNLSKLWFESNPRSSIVRSHMLPMWYFEMLHDEPRNARYKEAVQSVIRNWVAQNPDAKQCTVVDVGSGLGLLSVYAAQADEKAVVYAVESTPHLSETAKKVFAGNKVDSQIKSVKRDARHLTAKDIPAAADVLLFEVFDAGLLGEGILHFIEPLRNNIVAKNVNVMPLRAKVFAMVIELRTNDVGTYQFEQVNSLRYRPEYFNVDMGKTDHKILSEPFEVFEFDFQFMYRREFVKIDPQSKLFEVEMVEPGVASAVCFWWELQLTEDILLSTGPFEDYELHWKQAVQYIPEVRVEEGAVLPLVGFHNLYGINFAISPDRATLKKGLTVITRPPRIDKELEMMHEKLSKLQEDFYKAMTSEKEFLRTRTAVTRLALQPGIFGINPEIVARLVRSFY